MKKNIVLSGLVAGSLLFLGLCGTVQAEPKLVDDFKGPNNLLGGRTNVYQQAPSRALFKKVETDRGPALMIRFDKKNTGGPYESGGWCGYYTLLKVGDTYFDATPYKSLTFWVKGEKGGENFKIGMADQHWEQAGDSVKSEEIGTYLKAGQVTTEWQKAVIPMDAFFVEYKEIASIAICFEGDCFPDGSGAGSVYIDELSFE